MPSLDTNVEHTRLPSANAYVLQCMKHFFPIFQHHPNLVYLDSAATTQTPQSVIDAMNNYYVQSRSNVHRATYGLAEEATAAYETARDKVARFLNADRGEIIFVPSATYGLNMLAQMLQDRVWEGGNVALTRYEHHANLIPWQQIVKNNSERLRYIEIKKFESDLNSIRDCIDEKTKIVSFSLISNVLGTVSPVEAIIKRAKEVGATTIIDAAQAIGHMPIDVKILDCDALVISSHKMYGPTGIGILYVKKQLLETLEPVIFGGGMVSDATYTDATWNEIPYCLEPGTPPIAEAIGLSAAVDFLSGIGLETIQKYEEDMTAYAFQKLGKISGLRFIGPVSFPRGSIISFGIDGMHHADIALYLAKQNICVRSGHHCAYPLMHHLNLSGVVRASFGIYNSREDVDALVEFLNQMVKHLKF